MTPAYHNAQWYASSIPLSQVNYTIGEAELGEAELGEMQGYLITDIQVSEPITY